MEKTNVLAFSFVRAEIPTHELGLIYNKQLQIHSQESAESKQEHKQR